MIHIPVLWRILFFLVGFLGFPHHVLATPLIAITSFSRPIIVGQPFSIAATASGLIASGTYYIKLRLGSSVTDINEGQTFNGANDSPDDWLSDSDSWSKFPTTSSDPTGNVNISLTARPGPSTGAGDNVLVLRIRKTDASTNYDSSAVNISVSPAPTATPTLTPTSTPTDTPTPMPTSVPTNTPIPTKVPTPTSFLPTPTKRPAPTIALVTSIEEALSTAAAVATISPVVLSDTARNIKPLIFGLLLSGLGFAILSLAFVVKKARETRKGSDLV